MEASLDPFAEKRGELLNSWERGEQLGAKEDFPGQREFAAGTHREMYSDSPIHLRGQLVVYEDLDKGLNRIARKRQFGTVDLGVWAP